MSTFIGDWHALLFLLLAGVLPNGVWRVLGFWTGSRLNESSELLIWVRAVATAILAGVIMQVLITPPGALATVPVLIRFGAVAIGFFAYLLIRRSTLAGVIAAEAALLGGAWWWG